MCVRSVQLREDVPRLLLLSKLLQVPGKAAYGVLARARCWQAVDGGRQHACQVLLEQQQERQRSHAAASTSAAGSREQDAEAVGQLAGSTAGHAAAWQRVVQQAELAVETLESASSTTAAPAEFEELAWLLGLHGRDAAAHQLSLLLPGSVQPVGGALAGCLFPGASASAAELQQQAEDAATEASRASTGSAMQRAALHGQAAEACAAAGNMVPALFHAAEGHRLLAVLFYGGSDAAGAGPVNSARPGWWRLAAAYMGSLLQLGQLFEAAGQADEALHSLREGQRLVSTGPCSIRMQMLGFLSLLVLKTAPLCRCRKHGLHCTLLHETQIAPWHACRRLLREQRLWLRHLLPGWLTSCASRASWRKPSRLLLLQSGSWKRCRTAQRWPWRTARQQCS